MNWRFNILLLLLMAVPAFTGYPVNRFDAEVVAGASTAWIFYGVGVHLLVGAMVGARAYGIMLSIAAAVTLPVVMAGGVVSWLLLVASGDVLAGVFVYSPHYVTLCLSLLTVVPLALAMVTVLPFGRIEQHLLSRAKGVSPVQKAVMMAIRVFNHVAFSVIPGIFEVVREEQLFSPGRGSRQSAMSGIRRLLRAMVHIGVDAICASVQYIPLWAVEIAQLPEKMNPAIEDPSSYDRGEDSDNPKETS